MIKAHNIKRLLLPIQRLRFLLKTTLATSARRYLSTFSSCLPYQSKSNAALVRFPFDKYQLVLKLRRCLNFDEMEVSSFSAVSFKPRLHRPSFFRHVMLDTRERTCLPCSCVDSGPMPSGVSPSKRCNISACNGQTSRAVTFNQTLKSRFPTQCQVMKEESGGALSGESILLDEQTLTQELQIAIKEENYAQAAKIRDNLKFLQEDSKSSVLAANAKFYNSFRNGDLAAMQALWSKGDHVCVVHPGVSGISSHDLVMGSWEFVWADYDFPLEIEIKDVQVHVRGDVGYVTCIEMVKPKSSRWGRHFATNVFERVDGQWFMCIHHASYIDL